ncbi:MAG: hypothetical protein JST28_06420 [Acidobacteria bacterium]|nr:hypothetical protein [Acidobacteriota bacterium]
MSKANRLRRLCEIRRAEERNEALLLESAVSELRRIKEAIEAVRVRRIAGRALLQSSARSGELRDRITGIEEIAGASRLESALLNNKQLAEEHVHKVREQYLSRRRERRQVEILLRDELKRESEASLRRGQSLLDEWHRARFFGKAHD